MYAFCSYLAIPSVRTSNRERSFTVQQAGCFLLRIWLMMNGLGAIAAVISDKYGKSAPTTQGIAGQQVGEFSRLHGGILRFISDATRHGKPGCSGLRPLLWYRLITASLSRTERLRGRRAQIKYVPAAGIEIAITPREPGSRDRGRGRIRAAEWPACPPADTALAGARRVVPARAASDVHRAGRLLRAVVAHVLGPEPAFSSVSNALDLCRQRRRARHRLGAWTFESMDCVQ